MYPQKIICYRNRQSAGQGDITSPRIFFPSCPLLKSTDEPVDIAENDRMQIVFILQIDSHIIVFSYTGASVGQLSAKVVQLEASLGADEKESGVFYSLQIVVPRADPFSVSFPPSRWPVE